MTDKEWKEVEQQAKKLGIDIKSAYIRYLINKNKKR